MLSMNLPHGARSSENGEEKSAKPSHDTSLINGTAQGEESHDAPLQHVTDVNTGAGTLLFLGYVEAEPGQGLCEDADDVSEVIHAERVIIMEEGEEVTEELQDTQVEQVKEEEQEEEREEEEEYEEKGGEEKGVEEILEKKEEIEDEQGEEQEEGGEEEREEANDADFQNHLESGEVNAVDEEKRHTGVDLLNEDSRVNLHTHTDDETSVKTDADADTNPNTDSRSALNTGFKPDADPAAETLPPSLSESSECAVSPTQTSSGPSQDTAQKSPELNSSSANTAAHFHEIPLGGATVEEEPLLAAKAEPLNDAANPNRGEGVKTTTCRCCTVM
ncbi:hypothetical protein C0J50_4203 [Silurus asotus]|uniref:Uncharacterized protein n=1 Tax=Silurus asotus TaxID=30991 RepID=A0AAD5FFL0_SILAS|nr:hypothetical protein C0J50_4203 [Silurus asotus]